MNEVDDQYLGLLRDILFNGVEKDTRSGKVKSVFGRQMRFDLKKGFPILTTKKVFYRGCFEELILEGYERDEAKRNRARIPADRADGKDI